MEERYYIRDNRTGKFIDWCNDRWYGTTVEPVTSFTAEEVMAAKEMLDGHYVYDITVVRESDSLESTYRNFVLGNDEWHEKGFHPEPVQARPAGNVTEGKFRKIKFKTRAERNAEIVAE